ncbi:MAG: hypothetical protein ACKO8H_21330, partial [Microcystis panniformis]
MIGLCWIRSIFILDISSLSMINRQSLRRFAHKFNLILLIIATVFCLWGNAAFAHRPHDVISQVEVSP